MRALKSDTTAQDDVDDVGLRYMSDHALKKSEYNVSYLFAPSHTSNHVTYLPGRIMPNPYTMISESAQLNEKPLVCWCLYLWAGRSPGCITILNGIAFRRNHSTAALWPYRDDTLTLTLPQSNPSRITSLM
jgi:hypothetical protein